MSLWHCSMCGKYSDPQHLNYETGMCWECGDKHTSTEDDGGDDA